MAALSVTAASVLASAQATIRTEYTRAGTQTAGQAVYLNSSNQWALLDVNAVTLGINDLVGITLDGGAIGQPAIVCTKDPDFTPGATLTVGLVVYGSITAGGITIAEIPTTAEQTVVLGAGKTTTKMNLAPFNTGVLN